MLIPLREALAKVGWRRFPKRWQDTIIDSESHRSGLDLLYDPVPDYGAALRRVLGARGLMGPSDKEVRLKIGGGPEPMVRKAFKQEREREERQQRVPLGDREHRVPGDGRERGCRHAERRRRRVEGVSGAARTAPAPISHVVYRNQNEASLGAAEGNVR